MHERDRTYATVRLVSVDKRVRACVSCSFTRCYLSLRLRFPDAFDPRYLSFSLICPPWATLAKTRSIHRSIHLVRGLRNQRNFSRGCLVATDRPAKINKERRRARQGPREPFIALNVEASEAMLRSVLEATGKLTCMCARVQFNACGNNCNCCTLPRPCENNP